MTSAAWVTIATSATPATASAPRAAMRLPARDPHCAATMHEGSMRELRIHGRGGQGAVIASKVLAVALFREGRQVQSFPAFGVERRGAPVTAFLRVADEPIRLRCEIQQPDDLIILDSTLIGAMDVTAGLAAGGGMLINSERAPWEYEALCPRFRVATVDAGGIASAHGIGSRTQPIVNTAILGAFAAWSGLVSLDAVCDAIREEVPLRADANVAAAREAAAAVREAQSAEVSRG
jgi:2-oxoacid:acceptor oxidoreductase gamma subunit (pyruvate/2-ketoisovalerate family)